MEKRLFPFYVSFCWQSTVAQVLFEEPYNRRNIYFLRPFRLLNVSLLIPATFLMLSVVGISNGSNCNKAWVAVLQQQLPTLADLFVKFLVLLVVSCV